MYTINIPTIQHTRLTTIIQNISSINIHTSTHHPIKNHHNSQPSQEKTYLHRTMSAWGKNKPTNLPKIGWEKTGRGHCDTEW